MSTVLIENADLVATMDAERREIERCDVLIRDNVIAEVGPNLEANADETFDARGALVIPGLINTHNHIWGTLYRAIPDLQTASFETVAAHVTGLISERPLTPDALYAAALANMGKHLLTGCTTTSDHHWVYPKGQPLDFVEREIQAAQEIGMRFHPSRGCMSLGRADGGLVPDDFLEPEDQILKDAQELIEKYHDPNLYAMVRIILAPTAIYSDSPTIYREMRALSRSYPGVFCHTHLYQGDTDRMCFDLYGMSPIDFMEHVGWTGEDVVYYHFDTEDPDVLKRVKETRTSVSICTAIDMRLGYCGPDGATTPVRELLDSEATVCFGTSNPFGDTGKGLLDDMRVCLLANRVHKRERWITARDLLWMATRGGARALGREDLGSVEPGKAADLAIFDLQGIDMAGNHDPVAFLTASWQCTKATMVNGRFVAIDGKLLTVDQDQVARRANEWARRLVAG